MMAENVELDDIFRFLIEIGIIDQLAGMTFE